MQDKKTKKILIISVFGLIALRIFSLLLIPYFPHLEQYIISNIPGVEHNKYSEYFSAIHEGDDVSYYNMAEMMYKFDFSRGFTRGLAFPLTIVPFIFVFGQSFADIFFPMILFNGLILFSLGIALIVWLVFLIFKKIMPAILAGFLFLVFPFIFYVFRNYGPQFPTGAWNDINFFNMNWLTVMTDPLAAFFALLILFLMVLSTKKDFGLSFYSLIGFLAGFSVMIRITNVVFVAATALVIFFYEVSKKYKKLFFFCLFALIAFLPQFAYNIIFFDSPISFGYHQEYYSDIWLLGRPSRGMWDFNNFFHILSRAINYSWMAIPAFLIILGVILLGFFHIRKTNKRYAMIALLWFLFPAFFYMFFATGQATMRYYLPAVPAFVILSVATLSAIFDWFKAKSFGDKIG